MPWLMVPDSCAFQAIQDRHGRELLAEGTRLYLLKYLKR